MKPYKIVSGEDRVFQEREHIAFFGRSNVGKSSLINALLGSKSAKVSNRPGKTITFNFYELSKKTFFVDLPGYGYAVGGDKHIEKLRKRLLWYVTESGANIKKVVLVLDAKAGLTEADQSLLNLIASHDIEILIVANKLDKLNQKQTHQLKNELFDQLEELEIQPNLYFVSAEKKKGIKELLSDLN